MPLLRCPTCREIFWNPRALATHSRVAHRELGPIAHGTVAGYRAECNRNIPTCDDCRGAWRSYIYERRGGSSSRFRELRRSESGTDQ